MGLINKIQLYLTKRRAEPAKNIHRKALEPKWKLRTYKLDEKIDEEILQEVGQLEMTLMMNIARGLDSEVDGDIVVKVASIRNHDEYVNEKHLIWVAERYTTEGQTIDLLLTQISKDSHGITSFDATSWSRNFDAGALMEKGKFLTAYKETDAINARNKQIKANLNLNFGYGKGCFPACPYQDVSRSAVLGRA